ncbi:MAG: dTMP kinase [Gammaproteobacteria bacterium]|nr:dTMP kinase [Gammaproteobacteria bacterium]MYD77185.1 dTMP kinase [Gammaproteobacteria bacterium]MYJ52509.1 dTMP kinase [Gammaproteobacteria bacterium]
MKTGQLITVEGSDGSGKTTHLDYICTCLRNRGVPVVQTREPGGTDIGEALRNILIRRVDLEMHADTELLLMFAARMEHVEKVIRPALKSGTWVVVDRFIDASYAYQGGGRGISAKRIGVLEKWVLQGLSPDLTILLDVAVDVGLGRTVSRNADADRFEAQDLEFKSAVRDSYLDRARQDPNRIRVVDASAPKTAVQESIRAILEPVMGQFPGLT